MFWVFLKFMTLISMSRKFCNSILFENIFSGISCLIETSQLILACELAFALLDFLLREFSDQIKNDLFADFQNGLEISEIFSANTCKEAHFP